MEETTSVCAVEGTCKPNEPSGFVCVPTVVFLIKIEAPCKGLPDVSVTVPVTVLSCALPGRAIHHATASTKAIKVHFKFIMCNLYLVRIMTEDNTGILQRVYLAK